MNIIDYVSIFLILTPFYGVITDIKFWKIKNYFIFPLLLISIILCFFIEWFFNKQNIIWFFIIFLFWFLFYKNNKWWAGDWKYLILLWINSIILAFLKWFWFNIINLLFLDIFMIIFFVNIIFIILNFNKILKIKFKKIMKIDLLKDFWNIFFIFIVSNLISRIIWTSYNYIIIFLIILLVIPFIINIKNKYFYLLLIFTWIIYSIYLKVFIWPILIWIIYYIFSYLQNLFEQIFNIIDTKNIKIFDIKSWDILAKKSLNIINKDLNTNYEETPLQWDEVFDIIWYYKNNNKNINILLYKDIKLWIIMYIWYLITIYTIFK